jgi:NaMN:DMB phosphoribosyltransferase
MIEIYTQLAQGQQWLQQYRGRRPVFACILGFTATGLIPGISAAGATPEDRKYTAIADAEFLVKGVTPHPQYPLPSLTAGASPVLISRAVVEAFNLPIYLFNAGLPQPPAVPAIDLGGIPAQCLTSGEALPLNVVHHLFEQGLQWGDKLADVAADGYVILSECVVGGTTTALSILTGLGIAAAGKVNSSHPTCNHSQKWDIVQMGLRKWREREDAGMRDAREAGNVNGQLSSSWLDPKPLASSPFHDPFQLVAAVGDPMQIAAAGMVLAASRRCGVLLAGGTQMLAVYALSQALAMKKDASSMDRLNSHLDEPDGLTWRSKQVVVGTTRWVVEDTTGDTIGLANDIGGVPLLATQLSFATSRYPQLQAYERGFVKEGVGAGGCAIAAYLYQGWGLVQLVQAIEELVERYDHS